MNRCSTYFPLQQHNLAHFDEFQSPLRQKSCKLVKLVASLGKIWQHLTTIRTIFGRSEKKIDHYFRKVSAPGPSPAASTRRSSSRESLNPNTFFPFPPSQGRVLLRPRKPQRQVRGRAGLLTGLLKVSPAVVPRTSSSPPPYPALFSNV